jgi:aminoglycoside phosphotransferase (APT) family kinase protein
MLPSEHSRGAAPVVPQTSQPQTSTLDARRPRQGASLAMGRVEPPPEIADSLRRCGLLAAGECARAEALTGGVSSDIWRVDLPQGAVCIKRALANLKVAQEWRAPVSRNAYEVAWMQAAARLVPEAVPKVLGHDPEHGSFVMEFLDPARHRLWKEELRQGRVDLDVASAVGERLARIHAGTARDPSMPAQFPTDAIFYAIRLEPYLEETARVHADLASALRELIRVTATSKCALVHGDISPKNILIGPEGPIFLDAECAWYGDPAFDLAFCLNHLLLKCLWAPMARDRLLTAFDVLVESYAGRVDWEPETALLARVARLLPALFLARVDGKSPVEYVTLESDKERVRRIARQLLLNPPATPGEMRKAWAFELAA